MVVCWLVFRWLSVSVVVNSLVVDVGFSSCLVLCVYSVWLVFNDIILMF